MENNSKYAAIHYSKYLELDNLLECQNPRSKLFGKEAHDEHLFIVTHQVYELWFKQILHEIYLIDNIFNTSKIEESSMFQLNHILERILNIFDLCIKQIQTMETMIPTDFLEFRNYLFPASGFQSFQFRKVEVLLGLKQKYRITYGGLHYAEFFDEKQKKELDALENSSSLLESVEKWLERNPFLNVDSYDFIAEYKLALEKLIENETSEIDNSEYLSPSQKNMRKKILGDSSTFYKFIFDKDKYLEEYEKGNVRISYKAMTSLLFIFLYKEEPILISAFRLITNLSKLDESITLWRYRHTQMVKSMIGSKIGTGGSVGVDYLMETVMKHFIFKDFHLITTLLVPKEYLPKLPNIVKDKMNFNY